MCARSPRELVEAVPRDSPRSRKGTVAPDVVSSVVGRARRHSGSVTLWISGAGTAAAGAPALVGGGGSDGLLTSTLRALLCTAGSGRARHALKLSCVAVHGERVTDLVLAGQLRECEPTLSLPSAAGLATFEASTWKHGATRQHVRELSDALLTVKACQALLAGGLLKHQAPSPVPAQQVHTVVQLHLAKAVRAPGLTGRRSTPLEGRRSGPSCTSPSRPSAAEGKGRRRRRPFGGPATAAVSAGCVPKEGSECCIQLVGLAGVSMPAVAKALQRLAKSGAGAGGTEAPPELGAALWAVVQPALYSSSLVMTLELQDAHGAAEPPEDAATALGAAKRSEEPPGLVDREGSIRVARDCAPPESVSPPTSADLWQTWQEATAEAAAMSRDAQMPEHVAHQARTFRTLESEVMRLVPPLGGHERHTSMRASDTGTGSQPATPCVIHGDSDDWPAQSPPGGAIALDSSHRVCADARSVSDDGASVVPAWSRPTGRDGEPAGVAAQEALEQQLRLARAELAATRRQLGAMQEMLAALCAADRTPSIQADALQEEVEVLRAECAASTTRLLATEREYAAAYLDLQRQQARALSGLKGKGPVAPESGQEDSLADDIMATAPRSIHTHAAVSLRAPLAERSHTAEQGHRGAVGSHHHHNEEVLGDDDLIIELGMPPLHLTYLDRS